jgi:precorrin-8X/cobalt-precorrin-8 methylmutase
MTNKNFQLKHASVNDAESIESESLKLVEAECLNIDGFSGFLISEREVIKRMIHTTTCFHQVIESVRFINEGADGIGSVLAAGAVIITDTNMVKSGLSSVYLKKYNNETLCLVSDPEIILKAKEESVTRSHVAVREALLRSKDKPVLLACGNAPTFLYSAVETIVSHELDTSKIGIIAFPVGFVNVVEAKEYIIEFLNYAGSPGIVLAGRFGSSPLVVSAIHAIYRNYESDRK